MPFKSMKQMKHMFAAMPKVAKKWAKKYGTPNKVNDSKKKPGIAGYIKHRMKRRVRYKMGRG